MTDVAWWWTALGLGLVVAVVAVVLLSVLLREVLRIERGAQGIWHAGKQVAGSTATTWQLGVVSDKLDALAAEAGRHAVLLADGSGPDRGAVR